MSRYLSITRKNKFNNTKSLCRSGHLHDSKLESGYCNRLLLLGKAGKIKWFEIQVPYAFKVKGKLICTHIVDFVVCPKEGYLECHEVKGFETDAWKIKRKLFKVLYPTISYITVKKGALK